MHQLSAISFFPRSTKQPLSEPARFPLRLPSTVLPGKTVYTEGQKFLTSFIYDGSVHYTYETDNFSFEKHITLKRNANVCAVAYELTAGDSDCTFTLTPLFN